MVVVAFVTAGVSTTGAVAREAATSAVSCSPSSGRLAQKGARINPLASIAAAAIIGLAISDR
jgi:hypothetical protein